MPGDEAAQPDALVSAGLTTLLLSFGVPMLLGGDEMGRTQGGNNNAYCQDNEIAWFDWSQPDTELRDFTKHLIAFNKAHPVSRRRRFLTAAAAATEIDWFTPAGTAMTGTDWSDPSALALAIYLDGSDEPDQAEDGTPLLDDDFLVLVNAWPCRTAYQGTGAELASAAQSTSSVTASRIAATSPRPNASYTCAIVLMLVSALMRRSRPALAGLSTGPVR